MRNSEGDKEGRKQTNAGWLPQEWDCVPLEHIASLQTGVAKGKTDIESPIRLPYLRVANVQDGRLDLSEIKQIDVKQADAERYRLQIDDVLFTEGGDFDKLGRGTIWRGEIPNCLHQNHVFAVRCDQKLLLPYFLGALAASPYGRKYFILCSKQSTNLASINSTQLRKFPVPLPPLPEQRKITEILITWDEAIKQTQKLLDWKLRHKSALMQRLLTGNGRFKRFQDSWKEKRLGELFVERDETNCQHLPLLAITATRGVIPALEIDRKDSSSEDKSKYKRVAPGDIGYNTMRMWQGVSAVSALEGIVSPAYTVCIPKNGVDVRFMGYLFKFPPVVHSFWRYSQGLVDDTLNLKFHNFAQVKVRIPSIDEQHHIAKVIRAADEEIKVLDLKLIALEKQKQGLMQKLLTGEVRVRV